MESELSCEEATAIVVRSREEVGTDVENLCGADVRINFEAEDLEPEPYISEDDGASDEEVEEDFPAAAVDEGAGGDESNSCAAGALCKMRGTAVTVTADGFAIHKCMNCDQPVHGILCGVKWDERAPDCKVSISLLSPQGKEKANGNCSQLICNKCVKECSK